MGGLAYTLSMRRAALHIGDFLVFVGTSMIRQIDGTQVLILVMRRCVTSRLAENPHHFFV